MILGAVSLRPGHAPSPPTRARLERAGHALTRFGPVAVATAGADTGVARRGAVTCILAGRLYAPADLARQLEAADVDDGEAGLVAEAYRRWGSTALTRLRGSFAAVLWDDDSGSGVLASDLLATRRLFLRLGQEELVFGGELRDLVRVLPTRPAPDPVAFGTWLLNGSCPEGRTLYAGVARLGPGELVDLTAGRADVRTYWRPRFGGVAGGDRAELALRLRDALLGSTARRLSPESNGVILSGGVDSSIVTAAAHARRPPDARLRTYSAVFPGEPFDESDKIRRLTATLGIESRTFSMAPRGTLWQALGYVREWELPLSGMGSIVDMASAADAGADGCAVLLDGQTGDEVLGFAPYVISDRLRRGRLLSALRLIDRWPGRPPTKLRQRAWILRELGIKGALPHRLGQAVRDRRARGVPRAPWLRPELAAQQAELEDRWAWKLRSAGPLWWRQLADVLVYGPHREQRIDYLRHRSAGAAVVGESPLYDPDLIGLCLQLDPELAFDPRHDRSLARDAMRGLMPDEVRLQNRKANFGPFVHAAVTGADAPGLDRLLTAPEAEIGAYVDLEWVRRSWPQLRGSRFGETAWLSTIWRLASAEAWLQHLAGSDVVDRLLADPELAPPVAVTEQVVE